MPKPTKAQKFAHIDAKIRSALKAAQFDPRYDMQQESEEIGVKAEALLTAQLEFSDGKITEDDVRSFYKSYIALHERPLPVQAGLGIETSQLYSEHA